MAASRPRVSAAVCVYNEAANIGTLLSTLLGRDRSAFDELIVVSSGSTDGTDEIVRGFEAAHPQVRLISEPERRGKASAVNTAMREAQGDVLLLVDGDCLPAEGTLERMLRRFSEPSTGGVGSRNVVSNSRESMVARSAAAMWDLHHLICLERPVLGGDIVAFRRCVPPLPAASVNDDYVIEAALRQEGYRIEYEAGARVLMRAPTSLGDFLRQRRRIYAGFRAEAKQGAVKATQRPGMAAGALLRFLRRRPLESPWLALLLALEGFARVTVLVDELLGRRGYYTAWEPAASTKAALLTNDPREYL